MDTMIALIEHLNTLNPAQGVALAVIIIIAFVLMALVVNERR